MRGGRACRGVLVKGGRVLDALAACSSVALDKTGTLTTGVLVATGMLPPAAAGRPRRGAGAAHSALRPGLLHLRACAASAMPSLTWRRRFLCSTVHPQPGPVLPGAELCPMTATVCDGVCGKACHMRLQL